MNEQSTHASIEVNQDAPNADSADSPWMILLSVLEHIANQTRIPQRNSGLMASENPQSRGRSSLIEVTRTPDSWPAATVFRGDREHSQAGPYAGRRLAFNWPARATSLAQRARDRPTMRLRPLTRFGHEWMVATTPNRAKLDSDLCRVHATAEVMPAQSRAEYSDALNRDTRKPCSCIADAGVSLESLFSSMAASALNSAVLKSSGLKHEERSTAKRLRTVRRCTPNNVSRSSLAGVVDTNATDGTACRSAETALEIAKGRFKSAIDAEKPHRRHRRPGFPTPS